MEEGKLRVLCRKLGIQVTHKNHKGWLVSLMASLTCPFAIASGMTFKTHEEFPEYEVSSCGSQVRRTMAGHGVSKGKVLKQFANTGSGYPRVKTVYGAIFVHTMVCTAFHGSRGKGMLTCHRDDIPTNNDKDNLYWGTPEQNMEDSRRNGGIPLGEAKWNAKLTRVQADEIRSQKGKVSERKLASLYGVSRAVVNQINTNKIWR